jgi:D-tyrosyl-tRNA(Tyr) deacylase
MRAVIQRVRYASVKVGDNTVGEIASGLLILLGIAPEDNDSDRDYLIQKIAQMRIFSDEQGKMNRSILDVQGEVLIVSQFTLFADTKKGNRPSFIKSAPADQARARVEDFIQNWKLRYSTRVQTGIFGADMQVSLLNDGPVTITIDSQDRSC